jgi:hypothetical protein
VEQLIHQPCNFPTRPRGGFFIFNIITHWSELNPELSRRHPAFRLSGTGENSSELPPHKHFNYFLNSFPNLLTTRKVSVILIMGRHALKITRDSSDFNRRWCVMPFQKKLATHWSLLEKISNLITHWSELNPELSRRHPAFRLSGTGENSSELPPHKHFNYFLNSFPNLLTLQKSSVILIMGRHALKITRHNFRFNRRWCVMPF